MRTRSRQEQQTPGTPCRESRRIAWRLPVPVLLCVIVGVLALSSAPALAAGEQGHVFSVAFGHAGSGDGEFSGAAGIAVDEATGDVYVVDGAEQPDREV